jgi:hypothetical protein
MMTGNISFLLLEKVSNKNNSYLNRNGSIFGMICGYNGSIVPRWEREHMQIQQDLSDELSDHRQNFLMVKQAFETHLIALRYQRKHLRDYSDLQRRQEGFQQLQAAYYDLQRELRDYVQLLREQASCYNQQRQEYNFQREYVRAVRLRFEEQACWSDPYRR